MQFESIRALAAAASVLAAGAAHAGGVNWSIGISLPPIATVVSNGPVGPAVYAPPATYAPPVAYAPPATYASAWGYAPPPVLVAPARVVYLPHHVVRPVPMVVAGWHPPGQWRRMRGHKHGDWHDRD